MRAHSQRRVIWLLNIALAVALVALLAWIFLDVLKKVSERSFLKPAYAEQAVEEFKQREPTNQSALKPPVAEKELEEIDRPEFRPRGNRFHWLYSGPMPPPPPEEAPAEAERPKVEDDLSRIGAVRMLIYMPPVPPDEIARETVVFWQFKGGERRAFSPGEFVSTEEEPTTGILLIDVERVPDQERAYDLHYAVVEKPEADPTKTGVYRYDGSIPPNAKVDPFVRIIPARGAAGEAGDDEARAEPGVAGPGPGGQPGGNTPMPASTEKMVTWETSNRARVEVDQATYEWLRGTDKDALAQSVSTQVARDDQGRVIGLQITGLSAETPADRFDVKKGDILVSINDQPVKTRADALNIVQGLDENTSRVKVVIDRRGRLLTFNIDPRDPRTRRAGRYLDNQ
jgi:hypothetical protein